MKFRKKPVVIEAERLAVSNRAEMIAWIGGNAEAHDEGVLIPTLEGTHLASFGDYVIKGVKGEFYPCKPDIFAMTYEPAE